MRCSTNSAAFDLQLALQARDHLVLADELNDSGYLLTKKKKPPKGLLFIQVKRAVPYLFEEEGLSFAGWFMIGEIYVFFVCLFFTFFIFSKKIGNTERKKGKGNVDTKKNSDAI